MAATISRAPCISETLRSGASPPRPFRWVSMLHVCREHLAIPRGRRQECEAKWAATKRFGAAAKPSAGAPWNPWPLSEKAQQAGANVAGRKGYAKHVHGRWSDSVPLRVRGYLKR